MGVENKFARLMRNTGPARFFLPLGIFLIVFGVILMGMNTGEYVETTGRITAVTALPKVDDEAQSYDLDIEYTVDGTTYTTTFNLSGNYSEGGDIAVFYDPADPTRTTNTKMGGILAPVMIGAGALALVFGIFKTVKSFQKSKELDQGNPGGKFPSEAFNGFKNAPDVKEYYCKFDGKSLKPGYIVEDANRAVVFEGKMTKQALIGARSFEFVNHITGTSKTHEVGHTMTQTYNDEFFSAKSWFKFDGKNVWDVVHDRGIRLSTNLMSKFPNLAYDVTKNGTPFAVIETSGRYVHEDEAAEHKVNIPVGRYFYRIWTNSEDLDLLFLTVFAISETEQTIVE